MNKIRLFLLITVAASCFVSCEVEFSPNDNWKEIPVVYCLLDQDDDTSFVRVQRCYLGEGNQYQYASIGDSINYPQGALEVFVEEWDTYTAVDGTWHCTGSSPRHIYRFNYTEKIVKDSGIFYNTVQPVYECCTAGQLDSSCLYRLKVVKTATGDTIASSETRLIWGDMSLIRPNNVTKFQFSGTSGSKVCEIVWSKMEQARYYQPVVRFFYRDFIVDQSVFPWDTLITPHYIDIPCNTVKSNLRDNTFSTKLYQNYFLSAVKSGVTDDTCNKNIVDTVQLFVTCCTESLSAYIYAANPAGSLNQNPYSYTNIDGGLGVFAARRRHISFVVESPGSSVSQYKKALKDLGVGF